MNPPAISENTLEDLILRAWNDPEFKSKLQGDPKGVLATMGITVPDDMEIEVVENTPKKTYLTLPYPPIFAKPNIADSEVPVAGNTKGCVTFICPSVGCGTTKTSNFCCN